MIEAVEMIEDGLAVFRLTRLLTTDVIARPIRDKAHDIHPTLGELARCDWCLSIWIAAGATALSMLAPKAWRPLARGLAMSAAAGLIASRT